MRCEEKGVRVRCEVWGEGCEVWGEGGEGVRVTVKIEGEG